MILNSRFICRMYQNILLSRNLNHEMCRKLILKSHQIKEIFFLKWIKKESTINKLHRMKYSICYGYKNKNGIEWIQTIQQLI